jgi:hypothetical protein
MIGLGSPIGHETLTISDSATTLTASAYTSANLAFIMVETASIRFWLDDSSDPTASSGILLEAGDVLELQSSSEIGGFNAIAVSDDATIHVVYSRT